MNGTWTILSLLWTGGFGGPGRAADVAYDATLELRSGARTSRAHVIFDAGRFRIETLEPARDGRWVEAGVEVYDGNDSGAVWCYYPRKRALGAFASGEAALRALGRFAASVGDAEARRKLRIPDIIPIHIERAGPSRPILPTPGLRTKERLIPGPWTEAGTEVVARFRCAILVADQPGPQGASSHWRVSVEPKSGLVLKWSNRRAVPGSPVPPMRAEMEVLTVRMASSIPGDWYQVPKGLVVNVPEIFREVKLPPGTPTEHTSGGAWGTGIDYSHIGAGVSR